MKTLLTLLLAALPANAAAQAEDAFCADLRRSMATMTETGSYRPGWQAPRYAVFRRCQAYREGFRDEIVCTWTRPPHDDAAGQLAAGVHACLPAARRLAPETSGGHGIRFEYEFRVITVDQHGDEAHLSVLILEG